MAIRSNQLAKRLHAREVWSQALQWRCTWNATWLGWLPFGHAQGVWFPTLERCYPRSTQPVPYGQSDRLLSGQPKPYGQGLLCREAGRYLDDAPRECLSGEDLTRDYLWEIAMPYGCHSSRADRLHKFGLAAGLVPGVRSNYLRHLGELAETLATIPIRPTNLLGAPRGASLHLVCTCHRSG